MKALLLFISFVTLTGCSSLDTRNIIKTGVTTAVTSVIAGPVPAIANLVASVAVDEVLPEPGPKIEDIKSNKQLVAYMWSEFKELILYGAIAFFAFTTVITPWAVQRRARRKRKYDQYKYEAKLARESNARDN
jgi:hypothetical protein